MKTAFIPTEYDYTGHAAAILRVTRVVLYGLLFLAAYIGNTRSAQGQAAQTGTAPKGANRGPADNFSGVVWVNMLVPAGSRPDCVVSEVTFEPKGRTFWHKHPNGQVLVATQGTGYYQEKGKPIQIIRQGEAVTIAPEVVHWHGAGPNGQFTHIAINPNVSKGGAVNWLQAVTDEEYKAIR